jgi:hypothetical protein
VFQKQLEQQQHVQRRPMPVATRQQLPLMRVPRVQAVAGVA